MYVTNDFNWKPPVLRSTGRLIILELFKKLVDNRFCYYFLLSFYLILFGREEKRVKNNQFFIHL